MIGYSVIICTADRPADLKATLDSFEGVTPPDKSGELIIVDNGSGAAAEATRQVVEATRGRLTYLDLRYVYQAEKGLSRARNRGLAESCGEWIYFTDDDVRPCPDWLIALGEPLRGEADMVAGGVRLAPNLRRPWMQREHLAMMASTEGFPAGEPLPSLVGANMAFHRRVLNRVPGYDVELGAGTAYGGEESLFTLQAREAGFRLASRPDVMVEHHFQEDRLLPQPMRIRAERSGRETAYIMHHWSHEPVTFARRNLIRSLVKLVQIRRADRKEWPHHEGISPRELKAIEIYLFYRHYPTLKKLPRNYDRRGLVKKNGILVGLPGLGAHSSEAVCNRP